MAVASAYFSKASASCGRQSITFYIRVAHRSPYLHAGNGRDVKYIRSTAIP